VSGFDPGVQITRELIAANPDAALEHLQMLIAASQKSDVVVQGMQQQIDAAQGTRGELERMTEEHAAALRASADKDTQISALQGEIADSTAQKTSLITGNAEALAAYRDLLLKNEPALPPALISGGSLNEINASVEAARGVISHVQANIAASNDRSRMPSGVPMRTMAPDPGTMSRTEKILYGVRQSRGEEMTG
jgi:hypothetical protein